MVAWLATSTDLLPPDFHMTSVESSTGWMGLMKQRSPFVGAALQAGKLSYLHAQVGPTKHLGFPFDWEELVAGRAQGGGREGRGGGGDQHRRRTVELIERIARNYTDRGLPNAKLTRAAPQSVPVCSQPGAMMSPVRLLSSAIFTAFSTRSASSA